MADDFPIPGTRFIPLSLHEGGILCEREPPGAPSSSYDDGPNNHGSLKYYSLSMVENTKMAGPIVLNLYASCRDVDMNFFISLWDADPNGQETRLTEGYLKASHRELDQKKVENRGFPFIHIRIRKC
jgi:predicted acyl esterase